ncbi:MAG TPA: protein kinase [Thermoanaerobaculia bacterium]|nr:protein kinase [Thermoanaerobaculia bacterium]
MALEAGRRLGPYEVLSPIGAGGMGEVYKARDTRLGRDVAVKVLPQHLSENAEFKQRFEIEARAISALTHPHICTLYDVGNQDGLEFLVMELLEGESLVDRLGKGPLPMEQVLRYGIEIADALEKAHRSGIVHRDLKPGNVMLTKSGVKLLDFGLAKLREATGAPFSSGLSRLATQDQRSAPLTERGTVLGTYQYMSPEQVEGGEADARSDIFALGAVLYEMATGRKAFTGKSPASLMGAILRDEPEPISEITPLTPPAFARVVKTCLAKDPEHRFETAHDVKLQLQWIAEGGSQAGVAAPIASRRRNREKLAWVAAAVGFAAAALLAVGYIRRAPVAPRSVRFEVPTPPEVVSIDMPRISPDGKYLAFNATDSSGKTKIWLRPLNALAAQPLAGTEGTTRPFWSPDSRFLGFFAEGKLKKIDIGGGPPQKICDAPTGADGTWSPKGVILFDGLPPDPIYRVPAAGGTPIAIVKKDAARKEVQIGWPEFLPDGKHFLFLSQVQKTENNAYRIGSLDSSETKPLMPAQTLVTYAPPGYLLFVRDRTLVAQRFDPNALKTVGEPVPLAEQIGTNAIGLARFSVSRQGTLAYRTGEAGSRLIWVDRSGKEIGTVGDPAEIGNPSMTSRGDRLAFNLADPRTGRSSIWVRDLGRGVNSRFSFGATDEICPLWSPDGSRLVFSNATDSGWEIQEKGTGGEEEVKTLVKPSAGADRTVASDWSRDGRYIAYSQRSAETGWDIWMLPTFGDRKPMPFVKTGFAELLPVFSPDGKYVAYQSNESGRQEIYVRGFPGPGSKWQISSGGGTEPSWRVDGKEIFYRAADQKLMTVEVAAGKEGLQAGTPQPLFLARVQTGGARNKYLPSADGQRFLVVGPLSRESMVPTAVVLNWSADLPR